MTNSEIVVIDLPDHEDHRGSSFSIAAVHLRRMGRIGDLHVATIRPGCVRGNHYHIRRRELIIVVSADRWSLHWRRDQAPPTATRSFAGSGARLLDVPRYMPHALRNDGASDLFIVAATDGVYDPDDPDAFHHQVI